MEYKIYDQLPIEAKEIRIKVFMEEQGFKDEFDDLDEVCKHLVVFDHQKAIGTCRYYYDDPLQANVIGRIAVIKEYRGKKVGQYIVQSACSLMKGNVCLHAQVQAKPFYEKLGFKAYGEIDCDEFCPHTWMKKEM
ncbi:acetyltransferase [Faecalibacillus intestinalis]|jgi:predicted GNAT family N-acyltransferase|uniref:Acetyltransferase n=1 Tax=Faecalibacillus intestinalis TaxID=1982626 RepID=A0A7I8E3W5_9FIRM|nr:GNAT family N-acetyltransferase [Faecalibacillus intestinalis]BCL58723.1 acetyltransferase [Faecalibacillus intestinalis]